MAKPSEVLAKKKMKDMDDKKGSDKDAKPMKKNSMLDWISAHKKPTK